MLFHPDLHETLSDAKWDEDLVRATVAAIARDAEATHKAHGHWPVHPRDDEGDEPRGGFKGIYLGSAGVCWALWWLQRAGAVALQSDPVAAMHDLDLAYRAAPDSGRVEPSYFMGEAGVLLVQWRLGAAAAAAERLHAVVAANVGHPSNEPFLGAAGTLLAASHLWRATGEPRWRELCLRHADALWQGWHFDAAAQCHLWTQELDGQRAQYLGAAHGFAGNVHALLRVAELLDAPRREALFERCVRTLRLTARWHDGGANWPPGLWTPRPGSPAMLMQWCHGAPGIVTALADFPAGRSAAMDELLLAAGAAVWRAGPLAKGPGLCHGSAGNGLALLTLYRRSGDAAWLQRARAFAMHAIGQYEAAQARHGGGRHTLMTGDLGLAIFLWQCIAGRAEMPLVDTTQ